VHVPIGRDDLCDDRELRSPGKCHGEADLDLEVHRRHRWFGLENKVVSCTQPLPGGNELNPTANFKVGKTSYQIQIRVDPPLQSGTRPFGQTAGPSTASINLIASGNTSASWTTGDGNGSLILKADHKSGSLKGRLIGLGANGIATAVTGRFSCPTFTP
jgi:hypothetical protein